MPDRGTLETAASGAPEPPAFSGGSHPFSGLAREYLETLLSGNRGNASRLILAAAENGMTVKDI